MCGAALLAPVAMVASSLFGGGKSGTQSYQPTEVDMGATNPTPETQEPTLGVDNNESNSQAKKGKSSLVINKRNPSVGVSGSGSGSGVVVAGG